MSAMFQELIACVPSCSTQLHAALLKSWMVLLSWRTFNGSRTVKASQSAGGLAGRRSMKNIQSMLVMSSQATPIPIINFSWAQRESPRYWNILEPSSANNMRHVRNEAHIVCWGSSSFSDLPRSESRHLHVSAWSVPVAPLGHRNTDSWFPDVSGKAIEESMKLRA